MENNFFNINKLPNDGYIIFPLSMSRLQGGQSPEKCYEAINYFENKLSAVGIDGIFLYTNGLYYNNDEPALNVRKRSNQQMLSHRNSLYNLVSKEKRYIPQAMHFLPWDYVVLNSSRFQEFFQILNELKNKDDKFNKFLIEGLGERENNEANINFLIEEIVVNHIIRHKIIDFPKTLVKEDKFRLIVYPGSYFKADLYQYKNNILPKNSKNSNLYESCQYDLDKKILYDFNKIDL